MDSAQFRRILRLLAFGEEPTNHQLLGTHMSPANRMLHPRLLGRERQDTDTLQVDFEVS